MKKENFAFLLLMGGDGKRFGGKKQFLPYGNVPLYLHNLIFASKLDIFDSYILCVQDIDKDKVEKEVEPLSLSSVHFALAGKTRAESAYHALLAANEATYVFIHDAARPLHEKRVLFDLKERVQEVGGVVPTLPCSDSLLLEEKENKSIVTYLPRERVKLVQTPQAFRRDILLEAEEEAGMTRNSYKDEGALYLSYAHKLGEVEGSPLHHKITRKEDLHGLD